jgi:hypothetical protein
MFDSLSIETNTGDAMNREGLIRALRKYARKNNLFFRVDKQRGDGSHYRVEVGSKWTIIQSDIDQGKVRRILRQLAIDPAAL